MKNNKVKNGISLIMLIIIIVVMTILATSIILTLTSNNVINIVREATFKSDIKSLEEELSVYISEKEALTNGEYNHNELDASKGIVIENGKKQENKTIKDILGSMANKYLDKIIIRNGRLVYIGENLEEQQWTDEVLLGMKTLEIVQKETTDKLLSIDNSLTSRLVNFRIYGNSKQSSEPSLNAPANMKNVGDYDEKSGKYKITVNITGKNLLDTSKIILKGVRRRRNRV